MTRDVPSHYLALIRGESRGIGPTLQRLALLAASGPYGMTMRLRNLAYDRGWLRSGRVAVPVISVGNLTVGGTGKTPCVEYVAGFYRERGLRVAILSRGYGSAAGRNDEARVLEENLPDVPHLQGLDRLALAGIAIEELESEVLVLDDGFQHRRLQRDLDLVMIDATSPWEFGHLLPRGLLRESPRGLRRAGVVLLSRCDQVVLAERERLHQRIRRLAPDITVAETTHRPLELTSSEAASESLTCLGQRPVAAFCGIGNPDSFRRTLADQGAAVCAFRIYSDHHAYSREDVQELRSWARSLPADCLLVTTQKDLVKLCLTSLAERPLWALRVGLQIETEQDTLTRCLEACLRPDREEREP
jgi:tetraacyldisaccharide 4'-kinase